MNVVVTGASTGIGYETALQLATDGHTVYAISRRKSHLVKLKETAAREYPAASIIVLAGDLNDMKFLDTVVHDIKMNSGTLDVLVNNAGTLIQKKFPELTLEDWQQVYATNVFAAVNLTRKLLPLFSGAGASHIVNISSMGGFQGSQKFGGLSAYSSSKAALVGITECLAEEFKGLHIAVNCLCLGSVQTEMFASAFPDFKPAYTASEMGKFVARFALEGQHLFNGKIIPVSNSTP